jgi:metallophosphoesterase (TIGR00282 family)
MTIGVLNLMGRVFIDSIDCPFKRADEEIERLRENTNIIFVDMHAEVTSEKVAMGRYLDGRVSAVVGSHTHIQTADEEILPNGTAYLTDAGMTGPIDSVIGVKTEMAISRFRTRLPKRFETAAGEAQFNGAIVAVDQESGKAESIRRIQIRPA